MKDWADPEESPVDQLRGFAQWLLIVPFVMLLLFGCGQLAIFTSTRMAEADTLSSLSAEYGPWSYLPIRAFRSELIEELQSGRLLIAGRLNGASGQPVPVDSDWLSTPTPSPIETQMGEDELRSTDLPDVDDGVEDPTSTSGTVEIPTTTVTPTPTSTSVGTSTGIVSSPTSTKGISTPTPPPSTQTPTSTAESSDDWWNACYEYRHKLSITTG